LLGGKPIIDIGVYCNGKEEFINYHKAKAIERTILPNKKSAWIEMRVAKIYR
jgi:hypothetical protein